VRRVQFIGFWEYSKEDTEKVTAKFKQIMAERKRGTERFAKLVFGPCHFDGETKGFAVYETNDPDKLMSLAVFYEPLMTFKFVPLIDSTKATELWAKMKK
jgi:hypothetical protein